MSNTERHTTDRDSDLENAGERATDKAKEVGGNVKDAAKSAWDKASDAVERLIPGDSDGDGN